MPVNPFQFDVRASSPEELAAVVKDYESRGFEVVGHLETENESVKPVQGHYVDADGVARIRNVNDSNKSYGVIMSQILPIRTVVK